MAVRLKDVALAAGVDTGTVSHVLNHHPKAAKLRPETRERIEKALHDLGYCPNRIARAIKSGHSRILGLLSAPLGGDEWTGKLIDGILDVLDARGYTLRFFPNAGGERGRILRELREQQIEAVFIHAPNHDAFEDFQKSLLELHLPCATAGISNRLYGIGVRSDDEQAMIGLIGHALKRGYCNFCAAMPQNIEREALQLRSEGFLKGTEQFASQIKKIFLSRTIEWEKIPDHTAILCASDDEALKLLQKFCLPLIHSPSRIGIAGFGNARLTQWGLLPLTTVDPEPRKIGSIAAAELLDWLENGDETLFASPRNILVPVRIVPRASL